MGFARALPLLLLAGGIWGVSPSLAKLGMGMGASPLGIAFWVALGSGLVLLMLTRMRGERLVLDGEHLRYYLAAGITGSTLSNLTAYNALQYVPAGFFALLVPLSAMITVLGAAVLRMERLSARTLGGTALGFSGVALAMAPGAALPDLSLIGWALLAALTPVCYAASNLVAARMAPKGAAPLPVAAGTLLAAAGPTLLIGLVMGQTHLPFAAGWRVEALLLGLSGLGALAYLSYFRLIGTAGAVVTSQVGYIVTIAGVFWGWVLFGERLGALTLPAALLIFAGLWLVSTRKR
jgi:drug/metabolite transporter (DMT)-like permease